VTPEQLAAILPLCPDEGLDLFARVLTAALVAAECHTVTRAAAFLAQIGWESDYLRQLVEGDDGLAYEGRRDLGNTEPGDGPRYKGRGLIQITGRRNYVRYGDQLGLDLAGHPELAAEPENAGAIAAAYWLDHGCNAFADDRDLRAITERINGRSSEGPPSYHGRREELYRRALEVLGITALVA